MMNKLMKKIAIALTAATLTLTAATAAFANEGYQRTCAINITDTYEIRYVVAESGLFMRSDASPDAPVIGSLPYGTSVTVTGYVELGYAGNFVNWVQVSVNGVTGFVSTDYLSTTQPVQKQYANDAVTQVQGTYSTYVSKGYLALRNCAGYDANNEIGPLWNGSTVTVIGGRVGDYVQVRVDYSAPGQYGQNLAGYVGYVNANYLY